MSRMKIEWQHRRNRITGIPFRERLLAALPRIAPKVSRLSRLLNLASHIPGRRLLGLAPERRLPRWAGQAWRDQELKSVVPPSKSGAEQGSIEITADSTKPQVALFVDTFSRWFEPEIPRAARDLLEASGADVIPLRSGPGERPLCCGRTYLSAGMVDEAIHEAERLVNAARKMTSGDIKIVGLEPSCLYTLKDEIPALLDNTEANRLSELSLTLEDYLDQAWEDGRTISFNNQAYEGPDGKPLRILRHGHCHQKAFGGVPAADRMLARLPGVEVTAIESGCCGMAGAFGYHAEHYATSMAIGELDLLPQVRAAEDDVQIIADGTSCRAQIADGTGRNATHAAILLAKGLAT
jgi:Fe-S oxidoreductase